MANAVNRDFSSAFLEEILDKNVVEFDASRVAGDHDDTNSVVVILRNGVGDFRVNTIDEGYLMAYHAVL